MTFTPRDISEVSGEAARIGPSALDLAIGAADYPSWRA